MRRPALSPTNVLRSLVLLAITAILLGASDARAVPPDPAARGLDVFLHVAPTAAPGGHLEIDAKAYGFPTVTQAVPLPGASVEAGWDPESLDGATPPPSVTVKTDAEGRARLAVDVPPGKPKPLVLLVAVRHGGHSRVESMNVTRGPSASIELHTIDARVVPTSTISAWVRMVGPAAEPLANQNVVVSLLEGGVARHTQTLTTDRGGLVMARVPIPRIDEPVWQWTLRASSAIEGVVPSQITLTPREETPGTPTLEAAWKEPTGGARPGDRVAFEVRVRDAVGQPVIGHDVRYWTGLRGTSPPANDKDWEKSSTRATTNGAGVLRGSRDAPTLVAAKGTAMTVIVKTVVEGQALERRDEVTIGAAHASATLTPESPALVPGVTQRLLLAVADDRGTNVAGDFRVTADGLDTTVTTNERGEAEITWAAPLGIGASRNAGPCAGGVAAAVTVRPVRELPALRAQHDPFMACLPVDRELDGIIRVTPNVAKPGERVKVSVHRAAAGGARRSYSVVLTPRDRDHGVAAWIEPRPDGTESAEIAIPQGAPPGPWAVSVALPEGGREARVLASELLVIPSVLPRVIAKRTGGRATPGGSVEIEAQLDDGTGKGLPGSISAVVIDAFGGGRADISRVDTRTRLCGTIGGGGDRCDALLERAPGTEAFARSLLGKPTTKVKPLNDPGAHASVDLEKAFSEVLMSLEGAVFEAAKTPTTLLDARRREASGRWAFNPELFTLVTDAMSAPPVTPGGEPLVLQDLVAVDPQVTFDNVARRVTRLKLFRILVAVREMRTQKSLDPDEPVFKEPNAMLRRLVRQGTLTEDLLLDPWGGTIQYVKTNGPPPAPFLSSMRGFELHAPGPDGAIGTGDDVRDPFERVVRSGSPYARAVKEDVIVDAKWDMAVGEETVRAWGALFEELTGTQMGDSIGAGGLGLSGTGEGGGGRGEGIGLGSVGTIGHGRGTFGIANGDAYWSAPTRTDAQGRVKITVPLGAVETTWRVALVGVPDGSSPAATTLDVASELPLSVRAIAGARWVEGDTVVTKAFVRNRTNAPLRATITAAAEGVLALADANVARVVDVPANGARTVDVSVRAARPGTATLVLTARAPNVPDDVARHSWDVEPAGEVRTFTRSSWVDGSRTLELELDHGYRVIGEPRLVLERGFDEAVADALGSLEPEQQTSPHALMDSYDAALRVKRWATTRPTPRHRALAEIADKSSQRALGRYNETTSRTIVSSANAGPSAWALRARWGALAKPAAADTPTANKTDKRDKRDAEGPNAGENELCPPTWTETLASFAKDGTRHDEDDVLDVEPPPGAPVAPCWGAYVSAASTSLGTSEDADHLARAVLALAERPHRAAIAANLADRLRRVVDLEKNGEIDGGSALLERPRRAIVYAALLRAQRLGTSKASADALFARLSVLHDARGGYGSSTATLAVIRALLASQLEGKGTTHARVRGRGFDVQVDVPESGFVALPLPAGTLVADIEISGSGLVARLERPVLRTWSRPPREQESPVSIETVWPADAKTGSTGTLRVMLRHARPEIVSVDVRVPLPPGVTLAAPTQHASMLQGVLALRVPVDHGGTVLELPMRFGLAAKATIPEATARVARSSSGIATAPARQLVVR